MADGQMRQGHPGHPGELIYQHEQVDAFSSNGMPDTVSSATITAAANNQQHQAAHALTVKKLPAATSAALVQSGAAASMASPAQLVDLVKPGPSGTIASTAAVAAAAQAAKLHTGPLTAPVGLLSAVTPRHQQGWRTVSTVMQDLLRAAEKALASGLGDWHLQTLQDVSPQFQQHVLMGALGPETLKHKHKLQEPQILHLYGLLHRHCTGFQQEVLHALAGAEHMEQLLTPVWTAFAQLWDECVQVSFQGEVLAAIQELQATYQALLDAQDSLAGMTAENDALHARCSEFVRANLDHMLAWRSLKARADALEGEVAMLSSANSEISLRAAATAARNTQLSVQLEGLGARLASAEAQIQDREAGLATARAALLEKDSGLRRLDGQVAALEQQLVQAGQGSRRLEQRISELEPQLQHSAALVQDAERRVADKQRAFNLLHADFAKQKAEAAEAADKAAQLQTQVSELQQQLVAAHAEAGKAHAWRQRWEVCQMHVEDLTACNARAMQRRQELVSSYWPVMSRLNQAEDVVAALKQQLLQSGQQPSADLPPRDSRSQEVGGAAAADSPTATAKHTGLSLADSSNPQQQQQQQHSGAPAGSADQLQEQQEPLADVPMAAGGSPSTQDAAMSVAALQAELQQLGDSYLLLQGAYWRQKEQLLELEVQGGQLKAALEQANTAAAQASAALADARQAGSHAAAERARLEADLVGCRSWIRELEKTEQQYLKSIRQQGSLEQAATAAQRQADDLRAQVAAAESQLQLAQAACAAAGQERAGLLARLTQELNRSNLVEQALQQVHKQEVAASRAARVQLQQSLEQKGSELATARGQLVQAQQERDVALKDQQAVQQQLQQAQERNEHLHQQVDKVRATMQTMLQHMESLESRVSFVSSAAVSLLTEGEPAADTSPTGSTAGTCGSSSSSSSSSSSVVLAVEAAVHLMERLLVSLQCLAADAATISNVAAASKVEALVGAILQGLQVAASSAPPVQQQQLVGPAVSIVLLRNAASTAGQQRSRELEQQAAALRLQLADTSVQLNAALSANSRLQRALQLKTRAATSLEQQLASCQQQLQQAQAGQSASSSSIMQLQQELASALRQHAHLNATCTARAGELSAVQDRAGAAEASLQQLQACAAAAEATVLDLTDKLSQALQSSRNDAAAAEAAGVKAAAAGLQAEQLKMQLEAATVRVNQLGDEVNACRHKADICTQAARDAEYRAVATATLLADTRRELDFTLHMQSQQEQHAQQLAVQSS